MKTNTNIKSGAPSSFTNNGSVDIGAGRTELNFVDGGITSEDDWEAPVA